MVADRSKFGKRALVRAYSVERIDMLITDAPPPPDLAESLDKAGDVVEVAGDRSGPVSSFVGQRNRQAVLDSLHNHKGTGLDHMRQCGNLFAQRPAKGVYVHGAHL